MPFSAEKKRQYNRAYYDRETGGLSALKREKRQRYDATYAARYADRTADIKALVKKVAAREKTQPLEAEMRLFCELVAPGAGALDALERDVLLPQARDLGELFARNPALMPPAGYLAADDGDDPQAAAAAAAADAASDHGTSSAEAYELGADRGCDGADGEDAERECAAPIERRAVRVAVFFASAMQLRSHTRAAADAAACADVRADEAVGVTDADDEADDDDADDDEEGFDSDGDGDDAAAGAEPSLRFTRDALAAQQRHVLGAIVANKLLPNLRRGLPFLGDNALIAVHVDYLAKLKALDIKVMYPYGGTAKREWTLALAFLVRSLGVTSRMKVAYEFVYDAFSARMTRSRGKEVMWFDLVSVTALALRHADHADLDGSECAQCISGMVCTKTWLDFLATHGCGTFADLSHLMGDNGVRATKRTLNQLMNAGDVVLRDDEHICAFLALLCAVRREDGNIAVMGRARRRRMEQLGISSPADVYADLKWIELRELLSDDIRTLRAVLAAKSPAHAARLLKETRRVTCMHSPPLARIFEGTMSDELTNEEAGALEEVVRKFVDSKQSPEVPFLVENCKGYLQSMVYMQPFKSIMEVISQCKTHDTRKKNPDRVMQKDSCIWRVGVNLGKNMKCTEKCPCAHRRRNDGKHFPSGGGQGQGMHSRGTWGEVNMGIRAPTMRKYIIELLSSRKPTGKPFVLELWCVTNANKAMCARLGVAHVSIAGGVVTSPMPKGPDEFVTLTYKPDLMFDLSLVFTQLEKPLEFLIDAACKKLGPEYTRDGLVLITAAPRCHTFACMSANNASQGNFVTRHLDSTKPATYLRPVQDGRGAGTVAAVDDASHPRLVWALVRAAWPSIAHDARAAVEEVNKEKGQV